MYVRTFDPFYREMVYANRTPAAATADVLVSCPEQSSAHTDVLQEALQFPLRFQASVSLAAATAAAAGAAVGVGAVRTSLLAHHLQLAPPLTFLLLLLLLRYSAAICSLRCDVATAAAVLPEAE